MEGTTKTMINPDGQVWPCCYLASDQYGKPNKAKHQLLTKYHDNKDRYNLENDSIKNITHKDWFQKDLPKESRTEKRRARNRRLAAPVAR